MGELEKSAQSNLMAFLGKYRGQVEAILPKHLTPLRVTKLIVGQINKTPQLLACTPMSVVNCVLHAASMGLEIRQNSAYLVPFKDRDGRFQCTLLLDYRGKIDLACRSGKVLDIEARMVHGADKFELIYSSDTASRKLVHEPFLMAYDGGKMRRVGKDERGEVVLGYAIAHLKDAIHPHIEVMSHDEIEGIRAKSRMKDRGPWITDWEQMARKTLVHRICNYIPQSPELAHSQEIDDAVETGAELEPMIDVEVEDDAPLIPTGPELVEEMKQKRLEEASAPAEPAKPKRPRKEYDPSDIQRDAFVEAEKELGREAYLRILGNNGFASIDEMTERDAKKVWHELSEEMRWKKAQV